MTFKHFSLPTRALAIAALILSAGTSYAAVPADMADDTMPVSQLKAGMRGYGLTVFKGTQVEKFDVEVLGVLPKVNNGRPVILVRVGGGPITQRQTNIVAGMSGSPIYVNNKLIGAIAFGSIFSKEPMGMVTPIEDMMEALDPNLPTQPSGHSAELVALPQPVKFSGRRIENVLFANRSDGRLAKPSSASTLTMVPLATPLMISGMSARGIERISPLFERFNLIPMAGPGKLAKKVSVPLEPGAAVGVALATGDIEIAGVGTLTYVKGNKVLAMGHPLLGIGPLGAALTTAYVHEIIPSFLISTKIASPIEVVGKTVQDRPFSVSGEVGELPVMIPVSVTVRDFAFKRGERFNINVINHPFLSPLLIVAVAGESVYRVHSVPGDAVAKVSFEVEADEVGTIKRENIFFDRLAIDSTAVDELAELMSLLSRNRFYPVDVKRVNVNVEIVSKRSTAAIERIFVRESKYEPGDDVDVGVILRPYKSPPLTRMIKVKIPATLSSCKATLMVRGGGSGAARVIVMEKEGDEDEKLPVRDSSISEATVDNLQQLVDKFLEKEKNNELVAKLVLPDSAVTVSGEKLTNLPPVIAEAFKSAKSTGLKLQREEVKTVDTTDWIVSGSQSLPITVEKRDASEKARPSSPPRESGPPEAGPSPPQPTFVIESDESGEEEDYSALPEFQQMESVPLALQPPPGVRVIVAGIAPPPSQPSQAEQPKPEVKPADHAAKNGPVEKSVARQVTIWTQTTQKDFAGGEFEGTAATSADDLRPAPKVSRECEFDEAFVWCLLPCDDGGVLAGTGNSAVVYRVEKDGRVGVLADLPDLEVHALALDKSGVIYAGTGPEGRVYKIMPDGNASAVFDAEEKYVLALAVDSKGNVFAGTGDAPKIYQIDPQGQSKLFAELPGRYVVSLAIDTSDTLYAGVGGSGVVYAIKSDGTCRAVYDAGDQAVSAVQPDGKGGLYVATASKGFVVKVEANGTAKTLYSKAGKSALGLGLWQGRAAIALYNDRACLVADDETVADLDNGEHVQFTALAVSAYGDIYMGASNNAALYVYHPAKPKGTYESVAHDAKAQSAWGRIRWTSEVPEGGKLMFQTRTGSTSDPDETWSAWSPAYIESGHQILSPPARYIQYRAILEGEDWDKLPVLKDVSISFLSRNQPPTVKMVAPIGGEIWARKRTIKWSGQDLDGDTLTYRVFYSSDLGKTWQELTESKTEAEAPAASDQVKSQGEEPAGKKAIQEEAPAEVNVESGKASSESGVSESSMSPFAARGPAAGAAKKLPDKGQAPKAGVPAVTTPSPAAAETSPPRPAAKGPCKSTSYDWETAKVADGRYVIKIVATDKTSNATGALTEEKTTEPIIVCNTPPSLYAREQDIKVGQDCRATATGLVTSELVRIMGVDYRLDGGDWQASEPLDGLFDSPTEEFRVTTDELTKGDHELEIKAVDAAGNAATEKLKVKIE